MALKITNYVSPSGVILSEAYGRITEINFNFTFKTAIIHVGIYKDEVARREEKSIVNKDVHYITFNPNDKNKITEFDNFFSNELLEQQGITSLTKAYDYLKTLPFYINSIDV